MWLLLINKRRLTWDSFQIGKVLHLLREREKKTDVSWNVVEDVGQTWQEEKSRSLFWFKSFVYLVRWVRCFSCKLCVFKGRTHGLQFGPQLEHHHHSADSHGCHRHKQKNDGHDEENVQTASAPAAAPLERLNVHVFALRYRLWIERLSFGESVHFLGSADERLQAADASFASCTAPGALPPQSSPLVVTQPSPRLRWMSRLWGPWCLYIHLLPCS